MTDEEKDQAAAYLKLQDNVHALIVAAIYGELVGNPTGMLPNLLRIKIEERVQEEMRNYRVTKIGHTANQY